MIHLIRSIRHALLTENRLGRYALYAIGEIILVVVGILIAVRINNWNDNRNERREELKSYAQIKRQVLDDQKALLGVRALNRYYADLYKKAGAILATKNAAKMDTLAYYALGLSQYSDFFSSRRIYETLVNSGEISRLRNQDVTAALQRLDMTYNHINKLEDIHWEVIINELSPLMSGVINYATLETVKPEKLYSVEMQNMFIESLFLTQGKDSVYNKALREMMTVVDLIDLEISHSSE